MSDRRLFPESKMPMTDAEYKVFSDAVWKYIEKATAKGVRRSDEDMTRLSRGAGERAVKRSRGRVLSASERTLDLWAHAS